MKGVIINRKRVEFSFLCNKSIYEDKEKKKIMLIPKKRKKKKRKKKKKIMLCKYC